MLGVLPRWVLFMQAVIRPYFPYIHLKIRADVLVFRPHVGSTICKSPDPNLAISVVNRSCNETASKVRSLKT